MSEIIDLDSATPKLNCIRKSKTDACFDFNDFSLGFLKIKICESLSSKLNSTKMDRSNITKDEKCQKNVYFSFLRRVSDENRLISSLHRSHASRVERILTNRNSKLT